MTPKRVRERVKWIDSVRGDDEAAHSAEDALYAEVLRAIADGTAEDAQACAKEALKTQHIGFARWCA